MPKILSFHVPNPFKKKRAPSAASLAKFTGPTAGAPATTTPPPKAQRWSAKKSAQRFFSHFFKPTASTKVAVATAQQGVIQAVTSDQPLAGNEQYQAHLQVLIQDYAAALNVPGPAAPAPVTPEPATQGPADNTPATGLGWFEQQILGSKTFPMEPLDSALSRKEAEVKQALAQLSADMVKTGEPYRTVKLNDGSNVSASFNKDKSVFTVQDSAAYNSEGKFGEWVSVHTPSGSLRLNTVAPADHVSPGPALRDALANIEVLQGSAPAAV